MRHRPKSWRTGPAAAVLAAVALTVTMVGPAASGAERNRPLSFKGSCSFSGTVTFDPPLTGTTRQTHAVADAEGTCDGTLRRRGGEPRQLDDRRVGYHAASDGTQSCTAAEASGRGYLLFGQRRLRFSFEESRAGVVAPISLQGQKAGAFEGTATAQGDPAEVLEQCASDGLAEAGVDISGQTKTADRRLTRVRPRRARSGARPPPLPRPPAQALGQAG